MQRSHPDSVTHFVLGSYTLKGEGVETWHPRFRGNATRWVQVEGFPGTPTAENFAGLVIHTDFDASGDFTCANDLVNRVYQFARWGNRMQNRSVPMEPNRDERMAWCGHPEAAWSISTHPDRPIWERWDTDTQDGGTNGENQKTLSDNVEAWCYQSLGGISYDPEESGFKHIVLRLRLVGDLAWASSARASLYSRIESAWRSENGALELRIVVLPNTTATVLCLRRARTA